MGNQHQLTEIPEDIRNSVIDAYKTGIGINILVKTQPIGRDLIRRILRESKMPRMPVGRQVKFKPICPDKKVCPVCSLEKDKEDFGPSSRKDGLRSQCKTCRSEKERPGRIRRQYGITTEDCDKIFQSQNGLCACCGQPETAVHWKGKKRTLAIDHDHVTGKVRQLICHRCNIVIGLVKENPDICELVRNYILNHQER